MVRPDVPLNEREKQLFTAEANAIFVTDIPARVIRVYAARDIAAGEEITITVRGKPVAEVKDTIEQMLARKPRMLVTVALANKTARIVWALLMKQEDYRAPVAAA